MWETWVRSLGWEDSLKGGATLSTPVFWPGEFHGLYSPWGHKQSDTLSDFHSLTHICICTYTQHTHQATFYMLMFYSISDFKESPTRNNLSKINYCSYTMTSINFLILSYTLIITTLNSYAQQNILEN